MSARQSRAQLREVERREAFGEQPQRNEVVGRLTISFDGYPLSECGVSSRGSAVGQVFGERGVVELYAKARAVLALVGHGGGRPEAPL